MRGLVERMRNSVPLAWAGAVAVEEQRRWCSVTERISLPAPKGLTPDPDHTLSGCRNMGILLGHPAWLAHPLERGGSPVKTLVPAVGGSHVTMVVELRIRTGSTPESSPP